MVIVTGSLANPLFEHAQYASLQQADSRRGSDDEYSPHSTKFFVLACTLDAHRRVWSGASATQVIRLRVCE